MAATPPGVGFIGLGMMGRPMAARLHAVGLPLVVADRTPAALAAFARACPGARAAATLADFAGCAAVVTMLPDSDAVDAVTLGERSADDSPVGLIDVLRPGAVLIDMSSSQPLRTRALARALARAGIGMLDAPVSGGVKRALDGSLAIMVGGVTAVFDRWRPLLGHLGHSITHVGAAGAGHAMKALNNYVSAAGLVAASEALHAGRRFGLDPALMTEVLNQSTGRNNTTENKVKPYMLSGAFDSGFSLALMAKDLGTAIGLGESIGVPMPLGDRVLALWRDADRDLGAGADHTEMYRWLDRPRSAD